MSDYLSILILAVVLPLGLSFWPGLGFYRHGRALVLSITLILLIFGGWDVWATFRGHWHFNPAGVYQLRIINLPLEEVLFFIVIPFCCIFTWEALNYIRSKLK